ncbi:hypothetical protein [Candidatus Thioglobus sp. NP1]|uniref:hypothetical protein n=1 Tax=Candidatus Thioglobus sp. NP1 TaxID=2508687 RepID=UPI000DEDF71C|nr:hypothetical protein [Candidatus Thioglobus sp. NP1]
MTTETLTIDNESDFMRSPEKVMRLDRMGSSFPTRLSFMRTLIRRMARENWKFERTRREVDKDGYGLSIYAVTTPHRTYSLVGFTQKIPDEMRTDRVIAEVWDATFNLFDGVPTQDDIDYLAINTPKQEGGRYRPSELALARANKSLRVFKNAVDSLSKGQQPDFDLLKSVGYLMRTSAVYGSGKFGCADRAKIADREECKAPFQMELLTVYLIRWFTIDSVEELAKERGGKKAVKLNKTSRQFIGVGNATGLGMAPFLLKHPALIHNWVVAKETALARVRSIETPLEGTLEAFHKSLLQVSQHIDEWNVDDALQSDRILCLTDEIQALRIWCEDELNISRPYPWNGIYHFVEDNFSLECQEMIVSLIIEPHGLLVDDLAETMSTNMIPKFDADMSLAQLKEVVEDSYQWATNIDFSLKESQHHFWYYSEDKLEPRFGSKGVDDGVEQEMPLAIGRDVSELNNLLSVTSNDISISEFVMMYPEFRHIIRRIQNTFLRPYSEVQDNLLSESMRPIDLLRFKLAFFGASKFDPKSDLWTRVSMYQGAPMPDQLSQPNYDSWSFPIAERPNHILK